MKCTGVKKQNNILDHKKRIGVLIAKKNRLRPVGFEPTPMKHGVRLKRNVLDHSTIVATSTAKCAPLTKSNFTYLKSVELITTVRKMHKVTDAC